MMIRNLKVLGLALVAMLTMGIAAASASAAEAYFHSESASTTISGSQSTTNVFTTDSGTIHCTTVTFSGSQSGNTASNVVVAPTYSGCKSTGFIEANVTVDVNGCDYNITATGSVHLETCEAGKSGIVVTAPFCTITVTQGQTLSSSSFSNSGSGTTQEVTVDANVSNVAYHESGFACKNSGKSTTGGTYDGNVKVTGTSGGSHTGIWTTTRKAWDAATPYLLGAKVEHPVKSHICWKAVFEASLGETPEGTAERWDLMLTCEV